MLGILAQEKLIPLRYCPLQIEFDLVNAGADCVFVGTQPDSLFCIDKWSTSGIQCKSDLLTLDPSLQNEYASHLLSGKSLPTNFSSYNHINQATNGDKYFSCHIHRALTRLKSVFVTLFREGATSSNMPDGFRKVCNGFCHPAGATWEDLEKGQHPFQLQIGSKLIPGYPFKDSTQFFYHLRKTAGHPISIYSRWYHSTKYVIGLDMEKKSGAGFSGMNTKAGDLITVNFRDCHHSPINSATSTPSRMYAALHYDTVLNIRDSGVELLD